VNFPPPSSTRRRLFLAASFILLGAGIANAWNGAMRNTPSGLSTIAGGSNAVCFITAGNVRCSGNGNSFGGGNQAINNFLAYSGGDAVSVAMGFNHGCVLRSNGNVACFGDNAYGQSNSYVGGDAVSVSAGSQLTCLVKRSGNTSCYGRSASVYPDQTRGNVVAISNGGGGFGTGPVCYLLNDGNVRCSLSAAAFVSSFGYGNGSDYNGGDAVNVSVGGGITCVLRKNGNVNCWGTDSYNQLFNYTGGDAVAVAAGATVTCILKSNGNVVCQGANSFGQAVGYNGADAVGLASADREWCVVRSGGGAFCWGQSDSGPTCGVAPNPFPYCPPFPNITAPVSNTADAGNQSLGVTINSITNGGPGGNLRMDVSTANPQAVTLSGAATIGIGTGGGGGALILNQTATFGNLGFTYAANNSLNGVNTRFAISYFGLGQAWTCAQWVAAGKPMTYSSNFSSVGSHTYIQFDKSYNTAGSYLSRERFTVCVINNSNPNEFVDMTVEPWFNTTLTTSDGNAPVLYSYGGRFQLTENLPLPVYAGGGIGILVSTPLIDGSFPSAATNLVPALNGLAGKTLKLSAEVAQRGIASASTYKSTSQTFAYQGENTVTFTAPPPAPAPDTAAPAPISLSVTGRTANSISYGWIAVGDDGTAGTAFTYDFRYATYPITTEALFAGATREFIAAPQASGAAEGFTLGSLAGDATFYASIRAHDEAGNMGPISNSPAGTTLDVVPPSAVTDLAITATSGTFVSLTWTAPGDNGVVGRASAYDLRYTSAAGAFIISASTPVGGTPAPQSAGGRETFIVTGLAPFTTYSFLVRGIDDGGNFGAASNIPKTRTLDLIPPAPIIDLQARTGVDSAEIILNWTAVGDDGLLGQATGYLIKVSPLPIMSQAAFNAAQTVPQNIKPRPAGQSESFVVAGLAPIQTYFLAVEAIDRAGSLGALSNAVSTTSQRDIPPAAVTDLTASAPSSHTVLLTWTAPGAHASIGTATSYDVRWALSPIADEAGFQAATPLEGEPAPSPSGSLHSFVVGAFPAETPVHFALKTVNAAGSVSERSNAASATTTGEAAATAFVALPGTVVAGQSTAVRVLVTDAVGRPVPRIRVSFSVISGGGSFSPASALTDADGVAQASFAAPGNNEVDTIKATVEGFQALQASLVVLTGDLAAIEGFPTTPVVLTAGPTTVSSSALAFQWISSDPTGIADNFLMIGSQGDLALGDWVETSSIGGTSGHPFSLFVTLNGYIYNFGTPGTQYSRIQADGSLATWQGTLAPPFSVTSGFVHQGRIYVFAVGGGLFRPTIDAATGGVTAWSQVGSDFLVTNRVSFDAGATAAGYAYVIGGHNSNFNVFQSSLVYVAKIQADGSIPAPGQTGGWKQTTPLPAYYTYAWVAPRLVSIGSYLYVIGGKSAQTVFFARPNADGTIPAAGQAGSWTPTTPLQEANSGMTAVAYNNAIYLAGGDSGDINDFRRTARVFRAVPKADGTIPAMGTTGSWKLSTPLPAPLLGRAVVAGDRLYVHDLPSGKMRFAEILPNGNLGSWRRLVNRVQTGPLAGASPTQRHAFAWTSVPVAGGSKLFLMGGALPGSNAPVSDAFALFLPSPFVSPSGATIDTLEWRPAQALPKGIRGATAVSYRDRLYVIGGVDALGDQTGTIYSSPAGVDPLQWTAAGTFPISNSEYPAAAVLNGRLYITAIGLGRFETYGALLDGNGSVGAFVKMANLPVTTFGSAITTVLAHRGVLYAAVGNDVYSAVPDANGTITSWRLEPSIPNAGNSSGPLKFGLSASNQTLYATGGAGDLHPLTVYSAQIGNNGSLGSWTAVGHMPEVRNTGAVVIADDRLIAFGPRMDSPPSGQLAALTGAFHADAVAAPLHLSGSEVYSQSVGANSDFFGTNLALLRGQTYFASVRTKNPAGGVSRPGASSGVAVLPPSSPPDVLPPRTTLHIGLPSAGADPTFISPGTPLSFTYVDDRATVGDASGEGIGSIIAAVDGIVISTDPAAIVRLSTEGPHIFSFYATDAFGNTEQLQQLGVIVDGSAPATEILFPLPFDVVAGSYTIVQGVAVDTYTLVDRILVSTNNDVSFATATILDVIDGITYWQISVPMPSATSTVTIKAHGVDLVGNYDAVGSSVPVLVFNVVNTTMVITANPSMVSPGSLIHVQALAATQLGGPLEGVQIAFSATIANTLDPAAASGGVPMPAISFAPSVAVTNGFGVAATTLAVGGFDGQFTALVEKYAAAQFCIAAASLVGMTPAQCPGYQTVTLTATFMLQTGVGNGTLSTQAHVDAAQAQMQTIAQEQFTAASSAIFNKSVGVISITARVIPTTKPPFVSSASIKTNVLSIPYPIDLAGLPTSDNGEQPNSITYGDNNTATVLPLPGQTDSTYGRPVTDMDLISIGKAKSAPTGGSYRTLGALGWAEKAWDAVSGAVNDALNFIDPARISMDKSMQFTNFVSNAMFNTIPGAKLALVASAYGMDLISGNHQARDLAAGIVGDRLGLTLADLASFGILPPGVAKLIPPGLSVGLDVSGALSGKPKFGVNAGLKAGGTVIGYNNASGLTVSQQINGLQTYFNKEGFSSSVNLGSMIADTSVGNFAQHYGLKSISVGLLSGSYTGRMSVDIAKIKPEFDGKQFLKAINADFGADGFSSGGFGNIFKNLSSWASGAAVSFRNVGISFRQSSLFGGLGLGRIALPKPPNFGKDSLPPVSVPVVAGPIQAGLSCSAGGASSPINASLPFSTPANAYQSLASNSGHFSSINSLSGLTRNPVNSATGNLPYSVQDALIMGKPLFIQFVRVYNSLDFESGPLGNGWTFNYGMSLSSYGQEGVIAVKWGDGSRKVFLPNADGSYRSPYGTQSALSKAADGTFMLTHKRGTRYHFNLGGRLDLITDRNGNTLTLAYGGADLLSITDAAGKALTFLHDARGRITRMTDPSGAVTQYAYDAAGDLVQVSAPDYVATYAYDARHGMTSYQDSRSQTGFPKGSFTYNQFRQVLTESDGLGNRIGTLSYALVNNGVKTTVSDADQKQTVDVYDSSGAWVSRANALGGMTRFAFDEAGRMTQVTDADGGVTQLSYDSKGNKTVVVDPTGAEYRYTYDAKNNVISALLPNAGQITRTYDAAGNIATVTDAEGNVSRFVYDSAGLLRSYTDADQKTTNMAYDAAGNLSAVTRPGGGRREMSHDVLGRLTATIDENGYTTSFSRNPGGSLAAITYPGGQAYTFAYDANGKLARETDQLGHSTLYLNDDRGFLVEVTDAAGKKSAIAYDAVGRPIRTTDRTGAVYTTEYDALDRIVKETDPRGGTYQFAHDAVGRRTAITDPTGSILSMAYDGGGRLKTITSPEGAVTTLAYDAMGNLASQTDPNGGVTSYVYDKTGLVTKLTDAKGQETTLRYDAVGRTDRVTQPNGAVQSFAYNADGYLTSHTDGGGRVVRYGVDAAGQLTSVTDGLDRVTRYAHQWNGLVTSLTRPDGAVAQFAYDARGGLMTITDPNGGVTSYDHNPTGRVSKVTDAKGQAILYGYDAAGRPTSVTYPDGSSYQMGYDATGLPTSYTDPMGKVHTYTYDLSGLLTSERDLNGNQWTYAYDGDGRLTLATDPLGGTGRYAYDPMGNLVSQTNPNGGVTRFVYDAVSQMIEGTDPAGGVVKWTYDGVGNVLSRRDPNGNLTAYAYNLSGDMIGITDAAGSVREYVYDLAGQLTSETGPLGDVVSYVYDLAGRLKKRTDAVGAVTSYVYDLMGNRMSVTDPLGHVTTTVYDELNQVVSVTDPSGPISFAYDALGRVTSQTDVLGRVTSYVYQANGLPVTQTLSDGAVMRVEYDDNGNVTTVIDAAGNRTTAQYDALNRAIRATQPGGAFTAAGFDSNGNPVSVTDLSGRTTLLTYDLMNRPLTSRDPAGNVTTFVYDAAGNQTRSIDPDGSVAQMFYDALNRRTRSVDPLGQAYVYTYDAAGRTLTVTDPNGAVTREEYDLAGRRIAETDALGAVIRFVYDLASRLVSQTDALGRAISNVYDAAGRLVRTVDALGRGTDFAYDARGNRTSVTDPAGGVSRFAYDAADRLVSASDPLQNTTLFTYDANGNRTSATDPEGHVTRYEYEANGRLAAVVDPLGARRTFTYDGAGRMTSDTAADGGVTHFEYDAAGHLSATVDPLGNRVTRAYDARGQLATQTGAKGGVTRFVYDVGGRLTQVADALGGVWTYAYDAAGRLTGIVDANGHASDTFVYDAGGRLTSQSDALGHVTRFDYDAVGNRTRLIKSDGTELRYVYDGGDRVTSIQNQSGASLATLAWNPLDRLISLASPDARANYTYDAAGRLTRLEYPSFSKTLDFTLDKNGRRAKLQLAGEETRYAYDASGRLSAVTAPVGRGGQGTAPGTYEFTRDPVGRVLTRKYPNGVLSAYAYDAAGQLLSLAHTKADGPLLARFAYEYDANGNRKSMTDAAGRHVYGYDKLDRLVHAEAPHGLTQSYAYDAVGNRASLTRVLKNRTTPLPTGQPDSFTQSVSYAYDAANRLLSAGATSYLFDEIGRLVRADVQGEQSTSFSYDAFDRPAVITPPAASGLPDSRYAYAPQLPSLTFSPAPLGARTRKTDSRGMTQYVVDQTGNVAAELDQAGATRRRYTHTTAVDEPLGVTDESGHTSFILPDGLGSVALLTDERGDPVQRYQYDAFGQPSVTAQDKNSLKYRAREYDADVRLQYNRARYYDPALGRWITSDPLPLAVKSRYHAERLPSPQRLNRCSYADNRPLTLADPTGLTTTLPAPGMGIGPINPVNPGNTCGVATATKSDDPDSKNYETDTGIIIAVQKAEPNYFQIVNFLDSNRDHVFISETAKSELMSKDPFQKVQLVRFGIRDAFPLMPLTYLTVVPRLVTLGLMPNDAKIGASAMQNRSRLMTKNFKDFQKPEIQAEGLRLVVFKAVGPYEFVPPFVGPEP